VKPAKPVKKAAHALLVLAAGLAGGCQADADRDPQEYRKVLDASVAPADDPPADQPLTLERAMAVASRRDEFLARSGEDYVQALLQKNRIVATFLPTLSFAPSYTIGDRPPGGTALPNSGLSGAYVVHGDTLSKLEAPLVGSVNLFNGFGDVANLHSIEAIIAQRHELLLDLQSTVLLNVAQAFYAVLRSERQVEVLARALATEEARLADVEARLEHGLATKLAVAQTRAQVDQTRVVLLVAQSDVKNGRTTLARVVGLPAIPQPLEDSLAVPESVAPEPELEQAALDHRRDLTAARSAIEAARHGVDAAVSQYYPSITLDVNAFLFRESYSDASRWNALLSANLPIFTAGRIEAEVRIAWSLLRQAALDESALRRFVLHDVATAWENLDASRRRITALEDAVAAATEALDRANDAFSLGLAVNLDVLAAQDALRQAELALAGARFDRSVFYLDLRRAIGDLPAREDPALTAR
jgi:outer membrane protein TolC